MAQLIWPGYHQYHLYLHSCFNILHPWWGMTDSLHTSNITFNLIRYIVSTDNSCYLYTSKTYLYYYLRILSSKLFVFSVLKACWHGVVSVGITSCHQAMCIWIFGYYSWVLSLFSHSSIYTCSRALTACFITQWNIMYWRLTIMTFELWSFFRVRKINLVK